MHIHFLEASVSLTKKYEAAGKGQITKTPYPMTWEFTSHKESFSTLTQLEALMAKHAAAGHCMIKGHLSRELLKESRAGTTISNEATEWLVLDLDGLPEQHPGNPMASVDALLASLGMADVSYIIQWSASYKIENDLLRAHILVLLDKPYAAPLLKQWLIQQNHIVQPLREAVHLTKTGNALSWSLDVTACQNDKLIYIAPPTLVKLKDPLGKTPRIQHVKRGKQFFTLTANVHAAAINKNLTDKLIEELRAKAGLPKKKQTFRTINNTEVLVKPDSCIVTDMKQERGFVYFNLNGGDSWAYYHPENNPDFIFNFKGEPTYLTKELLPEYWSQLTTAPARVGSDGLTHLAFCDAKTAGYWTGTYNETTDTLALNPAKTSLQVRDYAKQFGIPMGDFIPVWDLIFDPTDNVRVDVANKVINTFSPSEYMKATAKPVKLLPKTIFKVISHALGGDQDIIDHFINWCAYIIQKRDRTRTAWVMHGVPGTGKGILCNNILRPIIGAQHTAARRMEELNEQYNHFMKQTFLVVVDEVQTKALQNERGVMAKLKNFITEEMVPIRAMYANAHEARNYTNWIFNSNMPDPVAIDKNDRRFNVGKYQPAKLIISDAEIAQIAKELQAFHDYLLYFPLDADKASQVLDTADRKTMIDISEASIDTVSSKLLEGNFEFFMDQLPAGTIYLNAFDRKGTGLDDYKRTLLALMARTDPLNGKCSIAREELRTMYDFVIGSMPNTPNKFTSLLKHHRIHIEKVWLDMKTVNGVKVAWSDLKHFPEYLKTLTPAVKPKLVVDNTLIQPKAKAAKKKATA